MTPGPFRPLVIVGISAILAFASAATAQGQTQQPPPDTPTFRTTSTLVFLDVTVLDKKGKPVVTGLSKDDFTITEDKKPQKIFSFEPPDVHVLQSGDSDESPDGKAPLTVLALDLLDSKFEDFAYIRYETRQFLLKQPEQLASPAEMLVVGNDSLEVLRGFTRSRTELLDALAHLPATLPYKRMNESFLWERFAQSIDALQQIALQNNGVPGRKNIVWIGHGGPSINLAAADLTDKQEEMLKRYVHATANMLVDARVTLFVIYPGLQPYNPAFSLSAMQADADIGETDPFAGDINFGVLVDETGGKLFYNRNDLDAMMERSLRLGAQYYTLTYQPHDVPSDGRFRRVRVTLKDPNLRALTKAGYFAPEPNAPTDPRQKSLINLVEAARSTIPLNALRLKVTGIVRHPDTDSADVSLQFSDGKLDWSPTDDGKSQADVLIVVASKNKYQTVLASRMQRVRVTSSLSDTEKLRHHVTHWTTTVRLPKHTHQIRVVMETEAGGRLGSAEVNRTALDAAPAEPTPEPQLQGQPAGDRKKATAPSS